MQPNLFKFSKTQLRRTNLLFTYIVLTLASMIFLIPFYSMITTAFKTYEENLAFPPIWFPQSFKFDNFREALFEVIPFFRYFFNSTFMVIIGTLASITTASIVAYGFARNKSKLSRTFFWILLATMMLPTQTTMISSYVVWANLGLVNTYVPLLITTFFGGSAFYIFLIRQFIVQIPIELEEAAIVEGANRWQIFTLVIVPLLKPVLATIAIFSFQAIWNDFMGPLIYIKDESLYTIAQAITLFQMPQETLWGPMMAAAIVTIVPILILFISAQKYFVSGLTIGGVKE
jgi:multiple sugar transport system permease protein